jgi:hypothetical protein
MGRKRSNSGVALPISSLKGGNPTLAPAPVIPPVAAPPVTTAHVPTPAPSIPGIPNAPPMMGGMDPLSSTIMWLQTNPYLVGMLMLLLNLGGRFLSLELTKKQEAFLQGTWIRPLIFFTVIFVATRNLVAAFWVTLLFFFVIWVAANENSPFCMIPSWCGHDAKTPAEIYEANIATLR